MGYGHWDTNGDGRLDGFEADRYMVDNHLYEGQQSSGGSGGGGCLTNFAVGLTMVGLWIVIAFGFVIAALILCMILTNVFGVGSGVDGTMWHVILIGSALGSAAILFFGIFWMPRGPGRKSKWK